MLELGAKKTFNNTKMVQNVAQSSNTWSREKNLLVSDFIIAKPCPGPSPSPSPGPSHRSPTYALQALQPSQPASPLMSMTLMSEKNYVPDGSQTVHVESVKMGWTISAVRHTSVVAQF